MIGEILEKIVDAEERASKILHEAKAKATKIETDAQNEIDKINIETRDAVARAMVVKSTTTNVPQSSPKVELSVPKDKLDKAEKYIIDQFNKRFAK
jgi:cell division septum initiation protein DivIVA